MFKTFKTWAGLGRNASGRKSARASGRRRPKLDRPRVALLLFMVAALTVLMSLRLQPDRMSLHAHDISPRELRADRSVIYVDNVKTLRLQRAAMDAVPTVYNVDEGAAESARRIVNQLFDRMESERAPIMQHLPIRRQTLQQAMAASYFAPILPGRALRRLLTAPPAVLQNLRETTLRLVDEAMDREIRDNGSDLKLARFGLTDTIDDALSDANDQAIAHVVDEQALRPNRRLDTRRTEIAREAASRAVKPVAARLLMGDKILGAGDVVTQEALDKLTALGLVDPRQELTTNLAIGLLSAVMVFLVAYYIARTLPALYRDNRRLALLATIVLLSVFGLKIGATMFGLSISGGRMGYLGLMSVTAAGMLVCVLLDMHLALLIVTLLSVQYGILMNHEIRFTVMTLMSSLVGIASVRGARSRTSLPTVAAALTLVNIGMVWLLGLLFSDTLPELRIGTVWAGAAAMLSTFLFWFGVLVLERPFGILTHTALLDLSGFDQPLLQRLCARAPGTYAHSMMVGTLAEAAAQAIESDGLLCRVAGYYHDIGKMTQPDFFVENQRQENVHGRLSPTLSALIIIGHVREGISMAKEARLPVEIRDIIAQHHGTTLISYFYHRALADNGGGEAVPPGLEERFRYPGPRPQTREAAVVMLADSVEAAARCIDKPDQERLQALIADIVRGKIEDGQLDECALTFRDMRLISGAFLHVLKAMMHGRIDYPKRPGRVADAPAQETTYAPRAVETTHIVPLDVESMQSAESAAECDLTVSEAEREAAAHLSAARPLVSAEVLYGHFSAERSELSSADRIDGASGAPPAADRGNIARRD